MPDDRRFANWRWRFPESVPSELIPFHAMFARQTHKQTKYYALLNFTRRSLVRSEGDDETAERHKPTAHA